MGSNPERDRPSFLSLRCGIGIREIILAAPSVTDIRALFGKCSKKDALLRDDYIGERE